MKNKLGKFYRKIGRTKFLLICFIPFGLCGLYSGGWLGLLAAIIGWCIGGFIYNRWLDKIFFKNEPKRVK